MTASRAKELLAALWIGAFVLGLVLRLTGVDGDAWHALSWTVAGLLVAGGIAIVALWLREQRDAEEGLRQALDPWLWSLAAILAIGGVYALLLALRAACKPAPMRHRWRGRLVVWTRGAPY